jgi:hypothetical protein
MKIRVRGSTWRGKEVFSGKFATEMESALSELNLESIADDIAEAYTAGATKITVILLRSEQEPRA